MRYNYKIRDAFRNCPEAPIMLYLLDNGPTGIGELVSEGVASNTALYRAISDLILSGFVEYDTSRQIPGRPLMLTSRGKAIALKVKEIDDLLQSWQARR